MIGHLLCAFIPDIRTTLATSRKPTLLMKQLRHPIASTYIFEIHADRPVDADCTILPPIAAKGLCAFRESVPPTASAGWTHAAFKRDRARWGANYEVKEAS